MLEEKKKTHKNIYGGNELFFFSLNQVQCIREFSYLCMLRDKEKKFYFCCNVLAALGTLKEPGLPRPARG